MSNPAARVEEYLRRMRERGYEPSLRGMDDEDIEWALARMDRGRAEEPEEYQFNKTFRPPDRDFAERIFKMFARPFDPKWKMPDLDGPDFRQAMKVGTTVYVDPRDMRQPRAGTGADISGDLPDPRWDDNADGKVGGDAGAGVQPASWSIFRRDGAGNTPKAGGWGSTGSQGPASHRQDGWTLYGQSQQEPPTKYRQIWYDKNVWNAPEVQNATTREEREAAINRIISSQGEGLMRHYYHMHGNENDAEVAKNNDVKYILDTMGGVNTEVNDKDPLNTWTDKTEIVSRYNTGFESVLDRQMQTSPVSSEDHTKSADRDEVRYYLDPNNFKEGSKKYQFMDLSGAVGISKEKMGQFLNDKGILAGQEGVLLEAAKKYNINEVYLAAHAALETGNGRSPLATGVEVNGVVVYNMFGISAFDNDPEEAARFAYRMGWTTPGKAIEGGAKWIAEAYVNNPDNQQNTLYKMRWNPDLPGEHQYATDAGWAVKQTERYKDFFDAFPEAKLRFDIPEYQ